MLMLLKERKCKKNKEINKVVLIDIERIQTNKNQPRMVFNGGNIDELAQSIKENGLLQPLTVREKVENYELISGERRLRACKSIGIAEVPCIIIETSDKQSAIFALLENIQREDLNYFEQANALKKLMVEWGVSQTELGERLGMSQPSIANKLRLLKYDDIAQKLLIGHNVTERQARALLKLDSEEKFIEAIDYISRYKPNTIQTEKYVEAVLEDSQTPKKNFVPIVKEVRIFFNTINKALKIMNESGINASAQKVETGNYIEYLVKIPLNNQTK